MNPAPFRMNPINSSAFTTSEALVWEILKLLCIPKKNQSGCHYHQKMLTHCPGIFTDVELVERETCNTLKRCLLEKLKLLGGTLDQEQVLPQEGLVESALTAIIILRCIKISDFLICTGMRFWCGL